MVAGLILMMFLLFRTFRKTLHVATNTQETILDILYERVNKILYYYYICAISANNTELIMFRKNVGSLGTENEAGTSCQIGSTSQRDRVLPRGKSMSPLFEEFAT